MSATTSDTVGAEQGQAFGWRPRLCDFAVCLSAANLCLLRVWALTPPYLDAESRNLLKTPYPPHHYIALILNTLLLTAALFTGLSITRRWSRRVAVWSHRAAGAAVLAVAANSVRTVLVSERVSLVSWLAWQRVLGPVLAPGLAVGLGVAVSAVLIWHAARVEKLVFTLLLVTSPTVPVQLGFALWGAFHGPGAAEVVAEGVPAATESHAATTRVVVVLFDEWDYALSFERRPAGLALAHLDEFTRGAVSLTQAYPPAERTMLSVPSLLTGKAALSVRLDAPAHARVSTRAGDFGWSDMPNLFSDARRQGFRSAIVGWYLPYCRIFAGQVDECSWWQGSFVGFPAGATLAESMGLQVQSLFEGRLSTPFAHNIQYADWVGTYIGMTEALTRRAVDARLDLVYTHLPIPHPPHFYDRRTGTFSLSGGSLRGYVDSLALLDRMLGQLLAAVEASSVGHRTTFILTTDHPYRTTHVLNRPLDHRVPFLVRRGGDRQAVGINTRVETLRLRELVNALLVGRLKDNAEIGAWLGSQAPPRASP